MPDKEGKLFAAVFGTLVIDTGEVSKEKDGETPKKDKEGDLVAILEDIQFIVPLNQSKELKTVIQSLAVEALTLKELKVAKKNGQLSHFVEKIVSLGKKKVKGPRNTPKK